MENNKLLLEYLSGLLSDERSELFIKILNQRTKYITVVLEDIYQSRNASAVLRTCDCFGIQDVHLIENRNEYEENPNVSMGSTKWLSIYRHNQTENNTQSTIKSLRKDGYRIVGCTPHSNDNTLDSYDLSNGKVALFFGNEKEGLSDELLNSVDEYLKVPMFGFTESFNISVSASIILYHLTLKLQQSNMDWHLTEDEKIMLALEWTRKSIKKVDLVEKNFFDNVLPK